MAVSLHMEMPRASDTHMGRRRVLRRDSSSLGTRTILNPRFEGTGLAAGGRAIRHKLLLRSISGELGKGLTLKPR